MSDKELYLKELNEQGKVLFSSDKYEEAIKKYMRAIEEDPMYLKTYFNACEAYIMADRYEEAKKMMKRVLLVEKNNGEAYFHLGNIALLENDYEEGRLQYAKAINCKYDVPSIYLNLASVAEENDEWEEAIAYYNKAIARDKLLYSAKIRKIQIYMMMKRNGEALNSAEDLINTNPEIFEGHHLKFVILATENKLTEAEKVLKNAVELFPDDQGFMFDYVKLYELQGNYEKALQLLDTLDEDILPKEVLLTEKAKLNLAMGNVDEAQYLLENYDRKSVFAEMEKLLILIYMDKKNYAGMLKASERIIGIQEHDAIFFAALYFRAYALKKLDMSDQAERAYKEACKIMQQACSINSGVLDLYIYRAICYRELKEYERAKEMIDYVELLEENLAEVHYIKHLVYKDMNDSRAEEELEKAKSLNPAIIDIFGE